MQEEGVGKEPIAFISYLDEKTQNEGLVYVCLWCLEVIVFGGGSAWEHVYKN